MFRVKQSDDLREYSIASGAIALAVGVALLAKAADKVERGSPVARIYGRDTAAIANASRVLATAFSYSHAAPEPRPLVYAVLRG